MKKISIGLIGFGTIGTGVARILIENASILKKRLGISLHLKKIADLDITTPRDVSVKGDILTTNPDQILNDPEIDIVIELIGGIEPARTLIMRAIKNKKHIVTANKALLAKHGAEILKAASRNGVDVFFEGSVGGGIPIIRVLKDGFTADKIMGIFGILNGTSNYILSRMTEENGSFEAILKDAQKKGFAESDPTLDIEGIDAAHKLCVLIYLAYGRKASLKKVYVEGISKITPLDIEFARELGYTIKLLAICRGTGRQIEARVHPTLIPDTHLLSQVNGTFNAIFLQGQAAGPSMFYGRGAGMMPTGTAVVADVIELARNILHGVSFRNSHLPSGGGEIEEIKIRAIEEIQTRYYLRFSAVDKPGILSKISGILGRNHISIYSVIQKGRRMRGGAVPIFMLTHEARESDLQKALKQIDKLTILRQKTMCIRIENGVFQTV